MSRACKFVIWTLFVLWMLALALYAIGTWGLFGQEPDPLSGVYLVLLGFPWTTLVDVLPEAAWPVAAALTPGVNVLVFWILCRLVHRR